MEEGYLTHQRPVAHGDDLPGRAAPLPVLTRGGPRAAHAVCMKYTSCTFPEALRAARASRAFPEPCTTFHFPYQS